HLSSVTLNYVNVTDSFVGGTYRYSGKGNVVLITNFEADSLDIRGIVVNQKGEKVVGAQVTVENAKGETVDELTTNSNGRFATTQDNGTYVLKAQASGYQYSQSVTVGGKNEIKEIEIKVVRSQFADVTQFTESSYDFEEEGETVVVDGNAKSVKFTTDNTGTFAVSFTVKNQMSTSDPNREAEPGVGIIVSGGGNTFACQFVRNSSRIIINGDWSSVPYGKNLGLYNLNNPGAEQQFLFVKSGNAVVFYALDKQGNYKTVMAYEDERFNLAYTYSFYITKKDSTKTLNMKLSGLKTYDSLSTLGAVKASLETVEGANGSVVVDNHSDGCYLSGKKYRVYGIPDEGKKLSSIWVDGNPVEFTPDGKDSGYVTITAGENQKVQAVFTSDPFDDGAGYGNYDYDKTLFYRNDLVTNGADPGVMFVSEEEDPVYGGWFYMTVTSSTTYERTWSGDGVYYRSAAYNCFRSKNLSDWELVGAIDGYALGVRPEEWAYDAYWAPEMIRDKKTGKYFLYFSARSKVGDGTNYSASDELSLSKSGKWDRLYLGIAMSDTPIGPYKLVSALDYNAANGVPNKNTNANGEVIDGNVVPINFAKNIAAVKNKGYDFWPAIDVSPFVDEDGTLYLYFSQHMSSVSYGNSIWMMKMKDMITPDYSTMRMVSLPGYTDVTSVGKDDEIYFNSG
ncbi:MAG: carboxypeptidase regulatory-like domain-containing protein, partial [Candidatus Neoclostridium sp.]